MDLKIKGVAVLTGAFGASGDLIPNVLIGSKSLPNQGMVRIVGLKPFAFRSIRHYSRRQLFAAGVAGVYTFDPNVASTISGSSMSFKTFGYDATRPNNETTSQSVLISVSANEALTNQQYCERIADGFVGNKFFTAAVSGSGASAVVTFTENYIIAPNAKYPSISSLAVSGNPAGSTFSKTTESVAQKGYTGEEVNMLLAEPRFKDMLPYVPNGVDTAANYDVYEITFDRREVTAPFDFSQNEPYKYMVFVKGTATNAAQFEIKMNALFDVDSSAFVPYNSEALAASVANNTIAQPGAYRISNGEPVKLSSLSTITGVVTTAVYFAINTTDSVFNLALTPYGAVIDLTGTDGNVELGLGWYEGDATADTLLAINSTSGDAISA